MVKLSDERIAFHRFWLWEYQRRNSEYKETYDNFMLKLSRININYKDVIALPGNKSLKFSEKDWELYRLILDEKNSFIEKFDREPKAYREGYDSENLLRDILSGNENYLFLPYVINGILKAIELPNYDRVDGYTEWPHLTVRLDLTEDLDLLLGEVSFYYYQFHYEFHLKKMSDSNEYSEHENFEDVLKRRQKSLNKLNKSKKGLKQGRPKALPRAVGLWLWDRWDKKGKVSQGEIIKMFFNEVTECKGGPFFSDEKEAQLIFMNGKEMNAYLEPRFLSRILSKTDECIEKAKVLPMK